MPFVERSIPRHRYFVHVPEGVEGPLPAILFLHGRGQSGADGSQLDIGLPPVLRERPADWPFLVICPQKPDPVTLWPDWPDLLSGVLEAVEAEFPVDPRRRYLTGLSQGGNGTLTLATALPWRFAAIAAVCGWADPLRTARLLTGMPTWLFHGTHDAVVPPSCSVAIADCMVRPDLAAVPAPRLTLYPGLSHNSWDAAYREPELPGWFLSHEVAD